MARVGGAYDRASVGFWGGAGHRAGMELELAERAGGGTTMTVVSTFASTDAMKQMIEMGMEEGMREAMGQIDGILTEAA